MTPQNAEDVVRQAAASFNAGRREDARQLCEQGLRRWPGQPTLNHFLAAVLFADGELDAARTRIEASLRFAPGHGPARLLAARIARAAQDLDGALAHIDRLAGALNAEAALEKARILDQTARGDAARDAWRAVLKTAPQNREAMARLGRLAWEAGDLAGARDLLQGAAAGDVPGSTWFDLGVVLQDLRDHAGAAAAYRQALERNPDHVEAAVNLGIALQDQGDVDAALLAYRAAYRRRPSTFGTIAMALTSAPHGRLWLSEDALRRSLES